VICEEFYQYMMWKGVALVQKPVYIGLGDLVKASFLERPNRFIIRCILSSTGEDVEAHLADPGRLKELLLPGATVYLRPVANPHRKTKWSASLVLAPDGVTLVSLQSTLANRVASEALKNCAIPELAPWTYRRAEYSVGRSRFDFLLEDPQGQELLLEVKSCTLVKNGVAMFPDAITARGTRHLQELTRLKELGNFEAAVLFVVQRADAERFQPARHIDPTFAQALQEACDQGVRLIVYDTLVDVTKIAWGRKLCSDFS